MTHRSTATASIASVLSPTWRRAIEWPSAVAWAAVATLALTSPDVPLAVALPVWAAASYMALRRGAQSLSVWRARARLAGSPVTAMRAAQLARYCGFVASRTARETDGVWLGLGFDWTPEHAQKLYELSKIDASRLMPPRWVRQLLGCGPGKPDHAIGQGYIDGLEGSKKSLVVTEKTLEGGTLIVGTTQAGKGVLLTSLVTQAIWRGDTVIVIDPKNSSRLKSAVFAACAHVGRDAPFVFHPAQDGGVRLNPLAHFARASELASRLTAVMNDTGPFTAFAWSAVHTVCALLEHCARTPTIVDVLEALNGKLPELVMGAIAANWSAEALEVLQTSCQGRKLTARETALEIYAHWRKTRTKPIAAIDAAASVLEHDPTHYAKITASLMPVLSMLTSGSLRRSLSPRPEDLDARPIVTLSHLLDKSGVLYVCLNSLPDPTVASAIGSILLADLASCAGARYNQAHGKRARVSLFVDECSNVINRSLIEILNKGAESGVRTTCAMQTVSDLAARLGSVHEARMALGNFNSLIALRTKDRITQEFAAETFGRTYIANTSAAMSTHTAPDKWGTFSGSFTRHVASTREELISSDVLGKLPNCEFFASLAGGRLVKGRIPILLTE